VLRVGALHGCAGHSARPGDSRNRPPGGRHLPDVVLADRSDAGVQGAVRDGPRLDDHPKDALTSAVIRLQRLMTDLWVPWVFASTVPEPWAGVCGGRESSRQTERAWARVGVIITGLAMCGLLLVSECSSRSPAAPVKAGSVPLTTETVRVGRLTEVFDTPIPRIRRRPGSWRDSARP
jgi:hypothetical protein